MDEIKSDKKLTVLEGTMPFKICSIDEFKHSVYSELKNSIVEDMVCLIRSADIIATILKRDSWEKDKKKKLPRKTREYYTNGHEALKNMILSLLENLHREYIFTLQQQKENELKESEPGKIVPASPLTKI